MITLEEVIKTIKNNRMKILLECSDEGVDDAAYAIDMIIDIFELAYGK